MDALLPKQKMREIKDNYSFSPPFMSQSPRYSTKKQLFETPGPGAYGVPSLDYQKTSNYHIKIERKPEIKKQLRWIFSSTRFKGFCSTQKNRRIGPGSYNLKEVQHSRNQLWDKGSRFRTKIENLSLPGPGSYQLGENQLMEYKQAAQSAFKSKTPKACLQFVGTAQKVAKSQDKLFSPIQEDNDIEQRQNKKEKSSFFASKVPRFLTESSHFQVGPGSYDLTPVSSGFKKTDCPILIRASYNKLGGKEKRQRINSEVGPGSYNMKKYEMSYDLEYKGQSFSRETRFNFKSKKYKASFHIPGPGQYMQQKYIFLDPTDESKGFKSKPQKILPIKYEKQFVPVIQSKKQKQGPGQYNLIHFNIDFKLRKKREHLQKLKIMDISMAPFSSKVPRFA